jgi:hypothetical protein
MCEEQCGLRKSVFTSLYELFVPPRPRPQVDPLLAIAQWQQHLKEASAQPSSAAAADAKHVAPTEGGAAIAVTQKDVNHAVK